MRGLFIAGAIVVVFAVTLLVLILTGGSDDDDEQVTAPPSNVIVLSDKVQSDIKKSVVRNSFGEFTILATEDSTDTVGWTVPEITTGANSAKIDKAAVVGVLGNAANLTADRVAEENVDSADLDKYGLNPPLAQIDTEFNDGSKLSVSVGKVPNDGTFRYVCIDGDMSKIYLVSKFQVQELFRPKEELISCDVFTTLPDAQKYASALVVKKNDALQSAVYMDEVRAALDGTIRYKATNADNIAFPLSKDYNNIIADFFTLEPLKAYSLGAITDTPEYTVSLFYPDQDGDTLSGLLSLEIKIYPLTETIIWNSSTSVETNTQVRRADFTKYPGVVFAIPVSMDWLTVDPLAYFEKQLFNYNVYSLSDYSITLGTLKDGVITEDKYEIKVIGTTDAPKFTVNGTELTDLYAQSDLFGQLIRIRADDVTLIPVTDADYASGYVKLNFTFVNTNIPPESITIFGVGNPPLSNISETLSAARDGKALYRISNTYLTDLQAMLTALGTAPTTDTITTNTATETSAP
jgi:hypothetical protein